MSDIYTDMVARDRRRVWHPYTPMPDPAPVFPVVSASGVRLRLADGRELVDGMSSWWCAIHGYNHPRLNGAVTRQLEAMAHVMLGGFTHEPVIRLAERLVALAPPGMEHVFFADSGSVSVEVAMKMAIQYQFANGHGERQKLAALHGGYHGDTFGAMSVCDPHTGMHSRFNEALISQYFVDRPRVRYGEDWDASDMRSLEQVLERHGDKIAALILEPIVQGAGGMWFYHPEYLRAARRLCDEHDVLLIADEIATGFGRTGTLFACEHAGISPDILCVGKSLTGGYMTLSAVLVSGRVARKISERGPLMHGPTFTGNPLACAVALESIDLLQSSGWQAKVKGIERQLIAGLEPCRALPNVADVRTLGAIGVVQLHEPVDMQAIPHEFVRRGVWVRPFGRLVYVMPPYIIDEPDLTLVTRAMCEVVAALT